MMTIPIAKAVMAPVGWTMTGGVAEMIKMT